MRVPVFPAKTIRVTCRSCEERTLVRNGGVLSAESASEHLETASTAADRQEHLIAARSYCAAAQTALTSATYSKDCAKLASVATTGLAISAASLADHGGKEVALGILSNVRGSLATHQADLPNHFRGEIKLLDSAISGIRNNVSGLAESLSLMVIGTMHAYQSKRI